MDTRAILANLRSERDRLNRAIAALEALNAATSSSGPEIKEAAKNKPRTMSVAGRQRIAEAQKKRWAKKKAAAKKSAVKFVAGAKDVILKTVASRKVKRVKA